MYERIRKLKEDIMDIKKMQADMIAALKAGDKEKKEGISMMIAAVKKVAIDAGCRENIPEDMVDATILKELKSAQEQVDTCPESRADLKEKYQNYLNLVKEYAPKMMGKDEIVKVINEKFADVIATKNKGIIMKSIMPEFKGKADGKLINEIVAELCK